MTELSDQQINSPYRLVSDWIVHAAADEPLCNLIVRGAAQDEYDDNDLVEHAARSPHFTSENFFSCLIDA